MCYPSYVPRLIGEAWAAEFLDFLKKKAYEASTQDMLSIKDKQEEAIALDRLTEG